MAMRTVVGTIYGKEYMLACDAGQEQHLSQLVVQLNQRAEQVIKGVGKLPEPMLLVYTGLMVADELSEVVRENKRLKEDVARLERQLAESGDDARIAALEEGMAESLHALAERIENLADKLTIEQ